MEVKSEQQFKDVAFTDIDIAYPGDLQSYVLRDGVDSYTYDLDNGTLIVTFGLGGTITFYYRRAHWIAIRPRMLRMPVMPVSAPEVP